MKSSPPRKGGAQQEREGERVAHLSIPVSFLGGRAHGSSLAALLRWGRGKCTVILEEWSQKWEWGDRDPARLPHCLCDPVQGPGLTAGSRTGFRVCPQHLPPPPNPLHLYSTPGQATCSARWAGAPLCTGMVLPPPGTAHLL